MKSLSLFWRDLIHREKLHFILIFSVIPKHERMGGFFRGWTGLFLYSVRTLSRVVCRLCEVGLMRKMHFAIFRFLFFIAGYLPKTDPLLLYQLCILHVAMTVYISCGMLTMRFDWHNRKIGSYNYSRYPALQVWPYVGWKTSNTNASGIGIGEGLCQLIRMLIAPLHSSSFNLVPLKPADSFDDHKAQFRQWLRGDEGYTQMQRHPTDLETYAYFCFVDSIPSRVYSASINIKDNEFFIPLAHRRPCHHVRKGVLRCRNFQRICEFSFIIYSFDVP